MKQKVLPIVLSELKKYNYKIDIILHPQTLETIQAIKNMTLI